MVWRRLLIALACALGAPGCGGHHAASPDGGEAPGDGGVDVGVEVAPPLTGMRSFDVVAHLRADPARPARNAGAALPPTDQVTLVLDADTPRIIFGGGGSTVVVPASTSDGRTFRALMRVYSSRTSQPCGQGISEVAYDALEVTVDGDRLRGTAEGSVSSVGGDVLFSTPILADLEGGPDVTAPSLVPVTGVVTSPFAPIVLRPSEPLPATARARLVGTDGGIVELVPTFVQGVIKEFAKPNVVLRPGGYHVDLGGLVDFAGNAAAGGAPLRIAMIDTPPLIPEDGFESARTATVGGAAVVNVTPTPLSGGTSVYLASGAAPVPPGVTGGGGRLYVRLPRQPGDTKVRFSYQLVSASPQLAFGAQVFAGVVDEPGTQGPGFPFVMNGTAVDWSATQVVVTSAVLQMEVPLAPSAASEVVVSIEPFGTSGCVSGLPAMPGAGLIVDNLRAE